MRKADADVKLVLRECTYRFGGNVWCMSTRLGNLWVPEGIQFVESVSNRSPERFSLPPSASPLARHSLDPSLSLSSALQLPPPSLSLCLALFPLKCGRPAIRENGICPGPEDNHSGLTHCTRLLIADCQSLESTNFYRGFVTDIYIGQPVNFGKPKAIVFIWIIILAIDMGALPSTVDSILLPDSFKFTNR